jgi:hypothetical protein
MGREVRNVNTEQVPVPDVEVLPAVAGTWLCQSGDGPGVGARLHRVVQPSASPQPHPLRHTGAAAPGRRQRDTDEASCRL